MTVQEAHELVDELKTLVDRANDLEQSIEEKASEIKDVLEGEGIEVDGCDFDEFMSTGRADSMDDEISALRRELVAHFNSNSNGDSAT